MFRALGSGLVECVVCYYYVTYKFQSESTLYSLTKCHWPPCLKQVPYLKFKWQQRDSNPQPLRLLSSTRPFSVIQISAPYRWVLTAQLNHLVCMASLAKWLSARLRSKWLWVRITLLSLYWMWLCSGHGQCIVVSLLKVPLLKEGVNLRLKVQKNYLYSDGQNIWQKQ